MSDTFDPYQEWLGISPFEPPPNHYRLLGLRPFEESADVIEQSVIRLVARVKALAQGQPESISRRVFADINTARDCLMSPDKKAVYDRTLQAQQPGLSALAKSASTVVALADEAEALIFLGPDQSNETAGASGTKLSGPPAASAVEPAKVGKAKLIGDYVILEKIGVGGMGHVFKAQHRKHKRIVAIKVLPPRAINSAESVRRFYREVESAAKLNHPNIVAAYDAGEQNNIHYLVMEFVDGKDLSVRLKDEGPLPVAEVVDYMRQAADGLTYAHGEGIVHRDVKPANLLLRSDGKVKILDMGLALNEGAIGAVAEAARGLTTTGQIMGTVDYMSPEQAEDTHQVDGRSDIYSLGCTMFRLLTNQLPFKGETVMKKILAHRNQPIPSLRDLRPEVPPALDSVWKRMVAKAPADRYATMEEVSAALQAALAPAPVPVARLAPTPQPKAPPASKPPAPAPAGPPPLRRGGGDPAVKTTPATAQPLLTSPTSTEPGGPSRTLVIVGIAGGMVAISVLLLVIVKLIRG